MKQVGILMACGALALGFGCDSSSGGDDGGIRLMDSGGGRDAGPPVQDTGPPDAGPPRSCTVASQLTPLPAECLPRCSSATLTCVMNCGSNAQCQRGCIGPSMDTTPPIQLNVGSQTGSLGCQGCWDFQVTTCINDSCPTQVSACLNCADGCNPMTAGCETEEMALQTCQQTNMAALQSCVNQRVGGCFPR